VGKHIGHESNTIIMERIRLLAYILDIFRESWKQQHQQHGETKAFWVAGLMLLSRRRDSCEGADMLERRYHSRIIVTLF